MSTSTLLASALAVVGVLAAPQPRVELRAFAPGEPAVFGEQPVTTFNWTLNTTVPAKPGPHVVSPRFRLFLNPNGVTAEEGLKSLTPLEAAYDCFVGELGWNSTGRWVRDDESGEPYYKTDITEVDTLPGSYSGYATYSERVYIQILAGRVNLPDLSVHEWGHALQWHQGNGWPRMLNARAWTEPFANWVADTYLTSDLCAAARAKHGQPAGDTLFRPYTTVGQSYMALVDATQRPGYSSPGNAYEAWPFYHYLTANPDNLRGMGRDAMLTLVRETPVTLPGVDGETPLHVLQRVLGDSATVADVVGKYWARMAYVDIDHEKARQSFDENQQFLNKVIWDEVSEGLYRPKDEYLPRYMGASIAPLATNGTARVTVNVAGPEGAFRATVSVRDKATKAVRYVPLPGGQGTVDVAAGEEASVVVANTPKELLKYNGERIDGTGADVGMHFNMTVLGAFVDKYS